MCAVIPRLYPLPGYRLSFVKSSGKPSIDPLCSTSSPKSRLNPSGPMRRRRYASESYSCMMASCPPLRPRLK